MRPAVSRRPPILALVLVAVAAACAQSPSTDIDLERGTEFVPFVADSFDNTGVTPSIAVDGDGVPYVAAFVFEQELLPGQLPLQRTIGLPSMPAVTLTSVADGLWTRGAVAMQAEISNVDVPFAPAILEELKGASPATANGTAIAADAQGGLHVAWASDTGVWYASNAAGSFAAEQVYAADPPLEAAGAIGPPSVALDGAGTPLLAFAVADGGRLSVVAATPAEEGWVLGTSAIVRRCKGCTADRVGSGFDGSETPFVVYADPVAGSPMIARSTGDGWESSEIEAGGGGIGLSVATTAGGDPVVAYYTGRGDAVHVAVASDGSWSVSTAAELAAAEVAQGTEPGRLRRTTAVAVDGQGTVYVAWYDPVADHVALASGGASSFATVPTKGTLGADSPALTVSPDGETVYLAWHDHLNGDLGLGVLGQAGDLALALPSPTVGGPEPTSEPTTPTAPCEPKGTKLKIVAPAGATTAGFDVDCLAAPAGEDFTIAFDNQDVGVQHNVAIYETDPMVDPATGDLFVGELITGPDTIVYEVGGIAEGIFFFGCDVHPTTMTGAFVAAKGK